LSAIRNRHSHVLEYLLEHVDKKTLEKERYTYETYEDILRFAISDGNLECMKILMKSELGEVNDLILLCLEASHGRYRDYEGINHDMLDILQWCKSSRALTKSTNLDGELSDYCGRIGFEWGKSTLKTEVAALDQFDFNSDLKQLIEQFVHSG